MNRTKIPWTDYTWNVVTGCTPISPGCEHCYAQAMARRFKWPQEVQLHPERLEEPRHLRKPSRIFVCSMSDLFHEAVDFHFIASVMGHMHQSPHTFQLLTKRPARMLEFFEWFRRDWLGPFASAWPKEYPNVWLGVTAENQQQADYRIPLLLQIPAAVHFVSVEPMLSAVNLRRWLQPCGCGGLCDSGEPCPMAYNAGGLDWVIAGCESGPGKRPARVEWFRDLKDQCVAAGVPFFLKQMASPVHAFIEHMPELDGQRWAQYPEVR